MAISKTQRLFRSTRVLLQALGRSLTEIILEDQANGAQLDSLRDNPKLLGKVYNSARNCYRIKFPREAI